HHENLAAMLSRSTKKQFSASDLPFEDIEFTEDQKAVQFEIEKEQWTCTLSDYVCKSHPVNPDEALSPDKKWAAYVKDHNLYVRNLSSGTSVPLTQDGIAGWDYATPLPELRLLVEQGTEDIKQPAAVFWSPDSKKLVTYRIDSRTSGRFTSVQFVPPDQLRPKAYSVVYPLPGEVLATAVPIIFDLRSQKRIDVKTSPLQLPFQDRPGFEWSPDNTQILYDYE